MQPFSLYAQSLRSSPLQNINFTPYKYASELRSLFEREKDTIVQIWAERFNEQLDLGNCDLFKYLASYTGKVPNLLSLFSDTRLYMPDQIWYEYANYYLQGFFPKKDTKDLLAAHAPYPQNASKEAVDYFYKAVGRETPKEPPPKAAVAKGALEQRVVVPAAAQPSQADLELAAARAQLQVFQRQMEELKKKNEEMNRQSQKVEQPVEKKAPEVDSSEDDDTCLVCQDEKCCKIAPVPCGHALYCEKCINLIKKCSLCNAEIAGRMKIFLNK